jgi:hypothetical protein
MSEERRRAQASQHAHRVNRALGLLRRLPGPAVLRVTRRSLPGVPDALAILQFKLDLLGAMRDAMQRAYLAMAIRM